MRLLRLAPFGLLAVLAAGLSAAQVPSASDQHEARGRLKEGQDLMGREQFAAAAEKFTEAIRLDGRLVLAHYGLGQARMALKEYAAALAAFLRARETFHAAGTDVALDTEKARDDRIRYLQDKIAESTAPSPGLSLSQVRARERRVAQWEIELSLLKQQSGVDGPRQTPAGLSLALGSAYFRNGRLADAEREYRAALEASPKMGESRNNLAVILLLTGRAGEAREQVKLAEKHGFKIADGLKKDIDKALASAQ